MSTRSDPLAFVIREFLVECGKVAERENLPCIYFMTREGYLLADAYRQILAHNTSRSDAMPQPRLLEVSRVSTFLPSLPDASWETLSYLSELNPALTIRGFLSSLGISIPLLAADLINQGIDIDAQYDPSTVDNKFYEFFASRLSLNLQRRHKNQRRLLVNYLEQNGISNRGKYLIVDIGWRGAAQDNIARLLPQSAFIGFYVGLFKNSRPQLKNTTKQGFIFDANNSADDHRFSKLVQAMAIEFPFAAPVGSVIDYHEIVDSKAGEEKAIAAPRFEAATSDELRAFEALSNFREQLHQQCSEEACKPTRQPVLRQALLDFIWSPNVELSQAFMKFENEQNFLHGASFRTGPGIQPKDFGRMFSRTGRLRLQQQFFCVGWPQACLSSSHPILYRILLRRLTQIIFNSDSVPRQSVPASPSFWRSKSNTFRKRNKR